MRGRPRSGILDGMGRALQPDTAERWWVHINDALVEGDTETVDQLIVRVLSRAHLTADALNEPSEARAILGVAHSFADELSATDPRFDREQFIHAATEVQS